MQYTDRWCSALKQLASGLQNIRIPGLGLELTLSCLLVACVAGHSACYAMELARLSTTCDYCQSNLITLSLSVYC